MKHFHAIRVATGALVLSFLTPSYAEDLGDRFVLRGFGTTAATYVESDGVEYRRHAGQAYGVADGEVDLGTDSIGGLQLNVRLAPTVDMVVQGISRLRADGDWDPHLSQAFVRWSPDESLVLRAGRVGYDIYLLAESRQVGYSYVPLRPTPEFYGLVTNDDLDGADITYTHRVGRSLVRGRVFGGDTTNEHAFSDGSYRLTTGYVYGGTFDWIRGGWMGRAAVVNISYDAGKDLAPLVAGLRMTGMPRALAIADDLDHDSFKSLGVQLGVAYDEGPVLAQLMFGNISSDSISGPSMRMFYGLTGYRVGRWTPFVSYADARDRRGIRETGLPDIPMFAPLNQGVEALQRATHTSMHTASAGVRFDLSRHVDFKFQVDSVRFHDSALPIDHRPPGSGPASAWVFGLAMDFVF